MSQDVKSPPDLAAADSSASDDPRSGAGGAQERILVVDDDPGMRRMLKRLLEPLGHQIQVAERGAQALEIVASNPIDLVLSDLKMPEMDGLSLLRNLRERNSDVAFILITAFGELEAVIHARDALNLSNFFVKPIFSQDKFLFDIMTALAKRRLEIENRRLIEALATANHGLEEKVEARTRELSEKNVELERVSNFRAEVLKVLSHELRTPMSILKGYMSLENDERSSDTTQVMRVMRHAVDRVQTIVDHAIQLKRNDEPVSFTVDFREMDPNAICASAVTRLRPLVAFRGIELAFTPSAPVKCRWDAQRMESVVEEVLINAVRASQDGKRVQVQVKPRDSRMDVLVRDEGAGIPEADRKRIFEPFVTLGSAERHRSGQFSYKAQGAGLGLAVAKLWVDLHGGDLYVQDNADGPGTCVVLSLPYDPEAAASREQREGQAAS